MGFTPIPSAPLRAGSNLPPSRGSGLDSGESRNDGGGNHDLVHHSRISNCLGKEGVIYDNATGG